MTKPLLIAATLLLAGVAFAKDDPTPAALAQLKTAAKCSDKASVWRPWCIATDWAKGKAQMPKGNLVGLTVRLPNGSDFGKAISENVTFVALAVTGDKLTLIDIKPSDKSEEAGIAEAVFNVAGVFKGKMKTATLPKDLAGYIKTRPGKYAAEKTATEVKWQGTSAAQLRKVGPYWVIIEVPDAADGIFVTILTDQWDAKP